MFETLYLCKRRRETVQGESWENMTKARAQEGNSGTYMRNGKNGQETGRNGQSYKKGPCLNHED